MHSPASSSFERGVVSSPLPSERPTKRARIDDNVVKLVSGLREINTRCAHFHPSAETGTMIKAVPQRELAKLLAIAAQLCPEPTPQIKREPLTLKLTSPKRIWMERDGKLGKQHRTLYTKDVHTSLHLKNPTHNEKIRIHMPAGHLAAACTPIDRQKRKGFSMEISLPKSPTVYIAGNLINPLKGLTKPRIFAVMLKDGESCSRIYPIEKIIINPKLEELPTLSKNAAESERSLTLLKTDISLKELAKQSSDVTILSLQTAEAPIYVLGAINTDLSGSFNLFCGGSQRPLYQIQHLYV